jgi:hypothetical protein
MRGSWVYFLAAGAIGAMIAISGTSALAKTAKECNAEYVDQKAALKAAGTKKADFIATCRAEADTTNPAAPAATTPAPAPTAAAAPIASKTKAQCAAEYSANKAAIKAGGQTKAAFDADCRAGTEKIPTAAAPAATPAPAPEPTAAAPAPAPVPAAAAPAASSPMAAKPKPMAVPSATETELKAKCPSDTIVWVNTKSGIYHFAGTHNYGTTKSGQFMCEMDAKAAGDRAAENEKHP